MCPGFTSCAPSTNAPRSSFSDVRAVDVAHAFDESVQQDHVEVGLAVAEVFQLHPSIGRDAHGEVFFGSEEFAGDQLVCASVDDARFNVGSSDVINGHIIGRSVVVFAKQEYLPFWNVEVAREFLGSGRQDETCREGGPNEPVHCT